jgi:hypothetical protein
MINIYIIYLNHVKVQIPLRSEFKTIPDNTKSLSSLPFPLPPKGLLRSWEEVLIISYRVTLIGIISMWISEKRHLMHQETIRELTAVAKLHKKTEAMSITQFIPSQIDVIDMLSQVPMITICKLCELIHTCKVVNKWSSIMHKDISMNLIFQSLDNFDKDISLENKLDKEFSLSFDLDNYHLIPMILVDKINNNINKKKQENIINNEVTNIGIVLPGDYKTGYLWSIYKFEKRFAIISEKNQQFQLKSKFETPINDDNDGNNNTNSSNDDVDSDVFSDPPAHIEVIGVSFIYLDAIQYLLDIREPSLSICSFQGVIVGTIGVRIRSWIDKIETSPSYITVDKEVNLKDFIGSELILRFYFDNIQGITDKMNQYPGIKLQFKFMFHPNTYRTLPMKMIRNNMNMNINNIISKENWGISSTIFVRCPITLDLLAYLKTSSLEIEIWGQNESIPPLPNNNISNIFENYNDDDEDETIEQNLILSEEKSDDISNIIQNNIRSVSNSSIINTSSSRTDSNAVQKLKKEIKK